MGPAPTPIEERIMRSVVVAESGCWEWQLQLDRRGYGRIKVGSLTDGTRASRFSHRVAYEVFVGPVPDGLELDHLCRNPACCNPEHLEPVTHAENVRRGAAVKTHCPRGHEYDAANTMRASRNGSKLCRICRREQRRASNARAAHGTTSRYDAGCRCADCTEAHRLKRRAYRARRAAA